VQRLERLKVTIQGLTNLDLKRQDIHQGWYLARTLREKVGPLSIYESMNQNWSSLELSSASEHVLIVNQRSTHGTMAIQFSNYQIEIQCVTAGNSTKLHVHKKTGNFSTKVKQRKCFTQNILLFLNTSWLFKHRNEMTANLHLSHLFHLSHFSPFFSIFLHLYASFLFDYHLLSLFHSPPSNIAFTM